MIRRKAGAVDKLQESDDKLQEAGLIAEFKRADLYAAPEFGRGGLDAASSTVQYTRIPEGAGPPYPARKVRRPPSSEPRKG